MSQYIGSPRQTRIMITLVDINLKSQYALAGPLKYSHRSQFLLSTEIHPQFHTNLEAWSRRFASVIIHKVSSQGSSSDSTRVVIWTHKGLGLPKVEKKY